MTSYVTGYNGRTKNKAELLAWSEWEMIPPELRPGVLWILDESTRRGRPVGIGSVGRTEQQADDLALSRHHQVLIRGCCTHKGKRYAKNAGVAHAAFSDRTYHVTMTPSIPKYALAIDFIGDMAMLAELAPRIGWQEFSKVNGEGWHGQGKSYPTSRARWINALHWPLPKYPVPAGPTAPPAPTRIYAPKPTLRQRTRTDLLLGRKNDPAQVRALQLLCNFWGWRDVMGRTLIVDGDYGSKTVQAVIAMQRALKQLADGEYGSYTAGALQRFLDAMVALKAAA